MNNGTILRDSTRQLLNDRPQSLTTAKIAADLCVSTAWLTAFARGDIHNPGVVTIEKLNVYLKNINKAR